MKPYTFETTCLVIAAASFILCLTASFGSTDDPPRPTPRPGSLAAYAEKVTLDRSALGDDTSLLILTNDTIAGLAADGSITLGTVTHVDRKKTETVANDAERSRWQMAHHGQQQVISALERRRSQLELEIDQIEDLSLTAKTMARLEQSEARLQLLEREIAVERAELARIVRDARRRGAEPGWFR